MQITGWVKELFQKVFNMEAPGMETVFNRLVSNDECEIVHLYVDTVAAIPVVARSFVKVFFGAMTGAGHLAFTLADGLFVGQEIHLACLDLGTATDITVTPAHFLNGTALLFDTNGDDATLEWMGTHWKIKSVQSATLVP